MLLRPWLRARAVEARQALGIRHRCPFRRAKHDGLLKRRRNQRGAHVSINEGAWRTIAEVLLGGGNGGAPPQKKIKIKKIMQLSLSVSVSLSFCLSLSLANSLPGKVAESVVYWPSDCKTCWTQPVAARNRTTHRVCSREMSVVPSGHTSGPQVH